MFEILVLFVMNEKHIWCEINNNEVENKLGFRVLNVSYSTYC